MHYIVENDSQDGSGRSVRSYQKKTMKTYLITFLICLTSVGCFTDKEPDPVVESEFDGLAQECFDSTARVRSKGSIGTASAIRYLSDLTGTLVETDNLLDANFIEYETNRHVASDRGTDHVLDVWFQGDLVASQKCKTNESWFQNGVSKDIATIVIALEDLQGVPPVVPYAPYDSEPIKVGDKIYTIGCSDGRVPRARCGDVIKISNNLIYYTPKSIPGDSGGAIYKFSSNRDRWEIVGRTAWAIKQGNEWVGLAMDSNRVADIKSGRVSSKPYYLPDGAIPIRQAIGMLPLGAITCDQLKTTSIQDESEIEPEPLPVSNVNRRWKFPLRQKDIDDDKKFRIERKRNWTILGGVFDFFRSLIRFAFWVAVILAVASAWIAPTILSPLKYDWPLQFLKYIFSLIRKK